jgi:hypothetical protein
VLTFKGFLSENAMPSFTGMNRNEWFKYDDPARDRLKILISRIKEKLPVTAKDGKDVELANTIENINAVETFANSDESVKTFTLKKAGGGEIVSNQIGKSPIFGGSGAGGGATGTTEEGEALQCIFCAAMIGEGIKEYEHFTPEVLFKYYNKSSVDVDVKFDKIMKVSNQWFESGYVSAKHLIEKRILSAGTTYEFHRGSENMKAVYKAKGAALKKQGMPALQDDKWNPGDIWAMKAGFNPATQLNHDDIFELNAQIKDLFEKKILIGISLKQVDSLKKTPKSEVYNIKGTKLDKHEFTSASLQTDKGTYFSAKNGEIVIDRSKKADLRSPSNFGALNFELKGKGARGGRAGWGYIQYALKNYLRVNVKDAKSYRQTASKLASGDVSLLKQFYKMAKVVNPSLKEDEFLSEGPTKAASWWHAKLMATLVAHAFVNASNKNSRDAAISYLTNHAGSKVDISSVYIKVHE